MSPRPVPPCSPFTSLQAHSRYARPSAAYQRLCFLQAMRDDYFIIHNKIDALRRHANAVQAQAIAMASKMNRTAGEADAMDVKQEMEEPNVLLEKFRKGELELPVEFKTHADKLEELFKAADKVTGLSNAFLLGNWIWMANGRV